MRLHFAILQNSNLLTKLPKTPRLIGKQKN
jgi:hypothetical protein